MNAIDTNYHCDDSMVYWWFKYRKHNKSSSIFVDYCCKGWVEEEGYYYYYSAHCTFACGTQFSFIKWMNEWIKSVQTQFSCCNSQLGVSTTNAILKYTQLQYQS